MKSHILLSAACLLSTIATDSVAAPAPAPAPAPAVPQQQQQQHQKRSSFKVERVANDKFAGHNGPKALLRAYRKYGIYVPPHLVSAANYTSERLGSGSTDGPVDRTGVAKVGNSHLHSTNNTNNNKNNNDDGIGIVAAAPEPQDVAFLSPIKVAGQTLMVDFDTGSSDLWVFTSGLPRQLQRGHGIYNPTTSETFRLLEDSTFSVSYGDGSGAAGLVGLERVDVGGVSVPDQAVELAVEVSDSFVADMNTDGLMGLAFSAINTVQPKRQQTFFENVIPSLAQPVFTADLRPGEVGAYEFGRIDPAKFSGEMAWIPVNTTLGFWQFSSETFAVGDDGDDGSEPLPGAPGGQAIADTGTTLLMAAPETVAGYYRQVPGAVESETAGGILIPCDQQLPDLKLDIGGVYMARIKGEDINFAPVPDESGMCFGGLQASPADIQIFGDIFFKSQFVAFNGGNKSLGMAEHA